jgi:hypothetical protein
MPVNCCRREGLAKQVDRLAQMRLSTVRLDLRLRRHRPLPTPHRQQRSHPHRRLVLHRHRPDGPAQGPKTTRGVRGENGRLEGEIPGEDEAQAGSLWLEDRTAGDGE